MYNSKLCGGDTLFTKTVDVKILKDWYEANKTYFPDPLEDIFTACKGVFPEGAQMKRTGTLKCRLTLCTEDSADQTVRVIQGIAKQSFSLESVAEALLVTPVFLGKANAVHGARERIEKLVGAEEFKALASEIAAITPQIKQFATQRVFASQSYLFSINDGCGFSTYAELFADLLEELGIFEFCSERRIIELKLTQKQLTDSPDTFMGALADLKKLGLKRRGIMYCVDISEWLSMTSEKPFRDMLALIDRHTADNIFIFRVPFVETNILKEIKDALADYLFIREVTFLPFSTQQLRQCAEAALAEIGYTTEESAWQVFGARIAEEKRDGRFYGINTVKKVVCEMVYQKQVSSLTSGVDNVIRQSDILSISESSMIKEQTSEEMLSSLVGMENIAKRVKEIVAQINTAVSNSGIERPCLHMQFIGSPGTGKTTVARIIGKMLKESGVLRNGSFFEYTGRDLCGKFIGETAPKTAGICRDAYGSVLFIDEAYSLYRGSDDSRDFGREALETLIAEMENHRSDMVVIMAGYADEMKTLMQGNQGLKSRMPYVIEFPNYTGEQLFEIFKNMLQKSFSYDENILSAAKDYFCSIPESVISSKEFSNARFVRNLFERTWGKAAMRCRFENSDGICVSAEDFLQACREKEFDLSGGFKRRTVGF